MEEKTASTINKNEKSAHRTTKCALLNLAKDKGSVYLKFFAPIQKHK